MTIAVAVLIAKITARPGASVRLDRNETRNRQLHIFAER